MHEVKSGQIPRNQLPTNPLDLVVVHPRAVTNSYQFLEGTSMLAYVAIHPNEFPIVMYVQRLYV